MSKSKKPKFLSTDDWLCSFDESGSGGNLDFCLNYVANYILSGIEPAPFLYEVDDSYKERYHFFCKQKILKVRQECLKLGYASGEDWSIIHSDLL